MNKSSILAVEYGKEREENCVAETWVVEAGKGK